MGKLKRIGMVARWKPVHLGHELVLKALCEKAETAIIGIGSSNRYDMRNPFRVQETIEMIHLVLAGYDNYELLEVPDLGDGPRWAKMIAGDFGDLCLYVTANAWVRDLMASTWSVLHPVQLIAEEDRIPISGTMVRVAMARGEPWRELVPQVIARYLEDNGLIDRFRDEFGAETLASVGPGGH